MRLWLPLATTGKMKKLKKPLDNDTQLWYIIIMISKKLNAQMEDDGKFIILDGVLHSIIKQHNFDDFGVELDTFTLMNYAGDITEIYSYDGGETFVDEID